MRKSYLVGGVFVGLLMVVLLSFYFIGGYRVTITLTRLATQPSQEQSMSDYLSKTRELVKEKNYKGALARFEWFYEHVLEYDTSMAGVRNSFALSYWADLAAYYPPAKASMVNIRDQKTRQVWQDNVNKRNIFMDVVALNRTLGDSEKSVALFADLDKSNPDEAKLLWPIAQDAVVKAERYDLVRKYMKPLDLEYRQVETNYIDSVARAKTYGEPRASSLKKAHETIFVNKVVQLLEIAKNLSDNQTAKKIQAQALAVVNNPVIRQAFP